MARLVVADTDVLIDYLRGRAPGAAVIRELIADRRLRLTTITAFELRSGSDFATRRPQVMRLFRSRTIPFDLGAAVRAGEVAAQLRAAGEEIGPADSMQAGICLRYDLALATRNRRHFGRVRGLDLVDLPAA